MPDSSGDTVQHFALGERPSAERRAKARLRAPALTVLHHPDPRRVGERVLLDALAAGWAASLSRLEPCFASPDGLGGQPLGDRHLSRSPLRLVPGAAPGGIRLEVAESPIHLVADGAPVRQARELSAGEVARGVVLELAGRIVLLLHPLTATPPHEVEGSGLVGASEGLVRVRREIARVADLDVPVLLRGETGTGKELAARAIHQASRRRGAACVCVNLGAIPASLAASELFGAVKGAFTGAERKAGYFQRAHGGTLFLDEIGDAPAEVQVALLRVLETGEVQRVGATETQRVDVRLIAGTDADLEAAIRDGRFREALLHRLSGYEIAIPPLRERRDDIGRLLYFFPRQALAVVGETGRLDPPLPESEPWMPASIVARLARHRWPGNVRQLRNVARQLVIGSRGAEGVVVGPQVERLLREAATPAGAAPAAVPEKQDDETLPRREPAAWRRPAEVGEEELLAALRANRWELKPTAAQLGIARPSLYLLIARSGKVRKAADLSRAEILECQGTCGGDLEAMVDHLEVSRSGLAQRMRQLGIG